MKIRRILAVCALVAGSIGATDVAPSNTELEAMYDKAYRAFDAANYPQALQELDAIDARKPDLAASQNLRGVIYMRQGVYDKAEAALSEALRLDPKFWNARFNLAEIPFLKKDWAEARKRFQQLLTSNSAELQGEAVQLIQYKILLTYLLEGNDPMVDAILAKFELAPDAPAVHYANAAIALQRQNLAEAKTWTAAAEKNFSPQLNKLFAESLYEIGWLQKEPGQQRAALQLTTPAERVAQSKAQAKADFEQAQQAFDQRDFDKAAALAERADAADPNRAPIFNLRGAIALEQQKFDDAESFFKKALKADPRFREAQFNLADVPFRQKNYAKARERFEALLKQTPGGDKNQASPLINFKIFMTWLLEGKESRAQKMMEQFQFSGDTPALYYAQSAWEFHHNNPDKANDWIVSARKIYPLGANAAYASGFYDLGWLKSASVASTPAPNAAALTLAQNEVNAPAIEPSPIPGVENKAEEKITAAPAPAAMPGLEATSTAPAPKASEPAVTLQPVNSPPPVQSLSEEVVLRPLPSAAAITAPSVAPTGEPVASATAAVALQPPPAPVASATPAAAVALASVPQTAAPSLSERLDRWTDPRALLFAVFLLTGIGIIAWVIAPIVRRQFAVTSFNGRPAPVTGPQFNGEAEQEEPQSEAPKQMQFTGGPRRISVQLKASEPSLRRPVIPSAKRVTEPVPLAEPVAIAPFVPVERDTSPQVDFSDFGGSCVGPVVEQEPGTIAEAEGALPIEEEPVAAAITEAFEETVSEPEESWMPAAVAEPIEIEDSEFSEAVGEPVVQEIKSPETELPEMPAGEPLVPAFAAEPEIVEPQIAEPVILAEASPVIAEPTIDSEIAAPESEFEPIAQGQPVPYQTVVGLDEETYPAEPKIAWSDLEATTAPLAGSAAISALAVSNFIPQPTTTENMPETLQTPTAPVIRTPGTQSQTAQTSPAPQAAAGGVHTAVQITLSCEIASMQLTPTFKMGALQLRPISKVVTMRLAGPQQQQQAMNLQVNFEIARVQPAAGSLGQIRLNPSQQQRPATFNTPSFNISGLQLVSGFEAAPVQLTPSQQGQASVHLTAAFQITSVEFTPTFEIGGIILNASSKTATVQLPGAGATSLENAPTFEIANVQVTSGGEIGLLQLNPVSARRA